MASAFIVTSECLQLSLKKILFKAKTVASHVSVWQKINFQNNYSNQFIIAIVNLTAELCFFTVYQNVFRKTV